MSNRKTELTPPQQAQLESLLLQFDEDWNAQSLIQALGQCADQSIDYRQIALQELIKVDLERYWSMGTEKRVDDYQGVLASVGLVGDVPAELILAEFVARYESGKKPAADEYRERFPNQFEKFLTLFQQEKSRRSGLRKSEAQSATGSAEKISQPADQEKSSLSDERTFSTDDSKPSHSSGDQNTFDKEASESSNPAKGTQPQSPADPHSLPETFGRYKIQKRLGAGAMGAVYLAKDTQLDRLVALKTPTFGGNKNEQMVQRFYREARAAANLRNPNICPVYDVGEIEGRHYITMAFIEGRPLSDYVGQTLDQKAIAVIVRKLALALADAHAQGVIHRDLKPANIMVDQKRQPLVMDFGLARREDEMQSRMTQSGTIMGTPAYMSPEQVKGQLEEIDAQADIYSLGIILYELLTGALPFEGSVAAVIGQILTETARPPIELRNDVDPNLQTICLKMIAKQRADRYTSMHAVAKDLGDYLKGMPVKKATKQATESEAQPKPGASEVALPMAEAVAESPAEVVPVLDGIIDHMALPEMGTEAIAPAAAEKLRRHQKRSSGAFWKTPHGRYTKRGLAILGVLILIFGMTRFLPSPTATLQVVSNDSEIVVQIDGEEIASGDDASTRLTEGQHEFALTVGKQSLPLNTQSPFYIVGRTGRYRLTVNLNDAELTEGSFSLEPGKENQLAISLNRVRPNSSASNLIPKKSNATKQAKKSGNNRSKTQPTTSTQKLSTVGMQSKFLVEIRHRNVKAEQGWFSTSGLATTLSVRNRPLKFNGVSGRDSIYMHPSRNSYSSVIFDLDRPYKVLKGWAAIPLIQNERRQGDAVTPLVFKVVGDGNLLWQSQPIKKKDSMIPFEVDLKGISTLQLRVECPGDNGWAVAAWYQPALFFGEANNSNTKNQNESNESWPWDANEAQKNLRQSMGTALTGAPAGLDDPFSNTDIANVRKQWSEYLGLPETLKIGLPGNADLTMEFVLIPPGQFLMGMSSTLKMMAGNKKEWADASRPAHQVNISRPFYISRYEVSRSQFGQVIDKSLIPQEKAAGQLPANQLSWDDAVKFCEMVTEQGPALPTGAGLRLPTEAEWEYACRAGSNTRFWSGNQIFATDANLRLSGGQMKMEPIDAYLPNPFGLYNMHGNVSEWCSDRYSVDTYVSWTVRDPQGPPTGASFTVRGGSFSSPAYTGTSYWRRASARGTKSANVGFRPVIQLNFDKFRQPESDANDEQAKSKPNDPTPSKQTAELTPWAIGTWCYKTANGKFESEIVVSENGEVQWSNLTTGQPAIKMHWEPIDATRFLISKEPEVKGQKAWAIFNVPGPSGVAECEENWGGDQKAYATKWTKLFNGNDLEGWVDAATGKTPVKGWTVTDGVLSGTGGGNLMTTQDFANFELEFEWKIGTGGNGGVYYRDRPENRKKNGAVLEYAIHDDQNKSLPSQQCSGSLWNLTSTYGNAGSLSVLRGTDEWNQGIIQANGKRLTHWLNGVKSADIRVGSTAWKQAIQKSKKSEPPGFGQQETGRIVLQQHTGPVSFRNLRIRPMDNRSDKLEKTSNNSASGQSPELSSLPNLAIAPFNSDQAKKHQQEWAKHLDVPVESTNSIGMKFVIIPPGTFAMGEGRETHEVTLTQPFMLGTDEVTQEQYEKIMGVNPSRSKGGLNPVTNVSWEDAVKFCRRLSELPSEKAAGRVYRLPTEAQWEYACRSGTQTTYSFGDDESKLGDYGWFRDNSDGRTHPCGVKQPNAWGLSDMHGNVWEWCNDWFGRYPSGSVTDPKGPQSGSSRVLRGGSFADTAGGCRSAMRAQERSNPFLYGFRVSFTNDSNVANQNQNEAQPRSDVSKKRRTSKEQIAGRRSFESRQKLVQKYGGHSASEDAVSLAMEWIAKHQLENGSWSFDHQAGLNPDERSSPNPGEYKNSPNAATAMALLVFLGAGQTHREGDYKKVVEKGLAFLLANGKPTELGLSYLEEEGNMYSHGLVSIALCEAYAMSKDRRLAPAAQGVTQYILSCQDPIGGGWRYKPKQPGDTSVTGWQIMALNAAVMCGIDINEAALNQARRFLNSVAKENGAFYVYLPSTTAKKKSMTAIGLLSQLHLGWNENNEALINGVDWLAEQGPDFRNWEPGEPVAEDAKTKFTCDMYSNYYATLMIHQVGGEAWETWNPKMRDFLVATQATEGPAQGSWCFIGTSGNGGNAYSRAGGRLYTTALSALTLQTYYRYLPLYD